MIPDSKLSDKNYVCHETMFKNLYVLLYGGKLTFGSATINPDNTIKEFTILGASRPLALSDVTPIKGPMSFDDILSLQC
jgi:hypothetical protein